MLILELPDYELIARCRYFLLTALLLQTPPLQAHPSQQGRCVARAVPSKLFSMELHRDLLMSSLDHAIENVVSLSALHQLMVLANSLA